MSYSHARCVAVLDTFWGYEGKAPGMFRINPDNHSGRRLYWLLGHEDLWCTNACKEAVGNARGHGAPNPEWLSGNLQRVTCDLLLVCGTVAKQTLIRCAHQPPCRRLYIPHPAARVKKVDWDMWRDIIQRGAH
ncbi:MAG: hypothetical protein WC455_11195 [Dehalococcoidia bacterium]|jgi:hypothetical protein